MGMGHSCDCCTGHSTVNERKQATESPGRGVHGNKCGRDNGPCKSSSVANRPCAHGASDVADSERGINKQTGRSSMKRHSSAGWSVLLVACVMGSAAREQEVSEVSQRQDLSAHRPPYFTLPASGQRNGRARGAVQVWIKRDVTAKRIAVGGA